jgi:adenylylsulfate kinase
MDRPLLNRIIWLTGLSGAGKTTTAALLSKHLTNEGFKTIWLDGDQLRLAFNEFEEMKKFDKPSRLKNSYAYSKLANTLSNQTDFLIVSTISMFSEVYEYNRETIANYFEVFLDVPKKVREERDIKNIYSVSDKKQKPNVCGVDLNIDIPEYADFTYKFREGDSPENVVSAVLLALEISN